MAAYFKPYGPFKLPLEKDVRRIDKSKIGDFWDDCVAGDRQLEPMRGIYIFVLSTSHGAEIPYYVGKTTKAFVGECFQPHKIEIMNDALAHHHGTPHLYFLALESRLNKKAIKNLEVMMIGLGVRKKCRNEERHARPRRRYQCG